MSVQVVGSHRPLQLHRRQGGLTQQDHCAGELCDTAAAEHGGFSCTRKQADLVEVAGRQLAPCQAAAAQVGGSYQYVLSQYRALKEQLTPWLEQFQAQHSRAPRTADADASGAPCCSCLSALASDAGTRLPKGTHTAACTDPAGSRLGGSWYLSFRICTLTTAGCRHRGAGTSVPAVQPGT